MIITGGSLRGKTVRTPPGEIRPAMSRMRESLFATLGPLDDVPFLDIFAGSGLMGLEAWSRGARPVTLVERDHGKREVILANLAGLDDAPRLLITPAESFIQRNRQPFRIVYLDPPFPYRFKSDLLKRLAGSRSIARDGTSRIILHHPSQERLLIPDGWTVSDTRRYGGSTITIIAAEAST